MSYIQRFEVVGRGENLGANGEIIAMAGWDTDASLSGAVLLKVGNKLKNVRIMCELRGYCETRWENGGKLAVKAESDNYKIVRHGRVFKQMVEVVYDDPTPLLPSSSGSLTAFPFSFRLPKNNMPASFDSHSGAVMYWIKCSMLYQEGMKLLKSSLDLDTPVIVSMPEDAKMKLLSSPSQMVHEVAASSDKVGYSVHIPRRILVIGEKVEVDVVIMSTPEDTRLRNMTASLRTVASYTNQQNVSSFSKFPRPLSETAEAFNLITVGGPRGCEPIARRLLMIVDSELAQASFESPLISVKTILRIDITLDNSETPNVSYEVPVVVLDPPVPKAPLPVPTPLTAQQVFNATANQSFSTPPPSVHSSMNNQTPIHRAESFNQSQNARKNSTNPSMPPSPKMAPLERINSVQKSLSQPAPLPVYEEKITMESQLAELRRLQEEQAKLSFLLAEIQAMELKTQQRPAPMPDVSLMARSESRSMKGHDAATIKSHAGDTISLRSMEPNDEWTVEMVSEWVRQKGASDEVAAAFVQQEIDGSVLLSLSADDLKNELGVSALGVRRKIMSAIEKLRG
ncbi:polar growth protein [Podochytrium sp. JEL0797]|nr:polar growth protein [Podochytrium sp. JEL0797]